MDDVELRRKIVGTWRLVSVHYQDQASGERSPVYGAHPKGIQIATAAGRWLALMTAEGRAVPATEAERAQALKTMVAYTGRYRVEDGKVMTKVEAAWKRGLGRHRAGPRRPPRRRYALSYQLADAAPERRRQSRVRRRRLGAGSGLKGRDCAHQSLVIQLQQCRERGARRRRR
jgi:hypothetical protein